MSEFRRKLLLNLSTPPGPTPIGFETVVNAINQLSGQKTILRKFDDSLYVWVLTYTNRSATSHNLYVFNLDGEIVGQLTGITASRHYGSVMNNLACIFTGSANKSVTYDVFLLTNNTLTKIKTSPSVGNWINSLCFFMYADNSNNYHICSFSNNIYNCVFDYNITANSVSRTESTRSYTILWYHYDGSYFRGLMLWFDTNDGVINPSYIKQQNTVNRYTSYTYTPKITSSDMADMLPLFNHTNSYDYLLYELFARKKVNDVNYWYNIEGINVLEPTSLTLGNIVLPYNDNIYLPHYYGVISYLDGNGTYHAYSYNQSTGLIQLMI